MATRARLPLETTLTGTRPPTALNLLNRTTSDVRDCIEEMRKSWEDSGGYPITDDSQALQRFLAKFELLLQIEMKAKSSLLGGKKDYWNYFCELLADNKNLNDGLRFVKSLSELKTNLGKGRAFLRFSIVHHRLADTLQECFANSSVNREWYTSKALVHQRKIYDGLLSALYDLNEVQFDLAPRGYDLDSAWPTFARKGSAMFNWKPPSRSNSIASLTSMPTSELYASLSTSLPPDIDEQSSTNSGGQNDDEGLIADLRQRNQDLEQENTILNQQLSEYEASLSKCEEQRIAFMTRESELSATVQRLEAQLSEFNFKINAKQVVNDLSSVSNEPGYNNIIAPEECHIEQSVHGNGELTSEITVSDDLARTETSTLPDSLDGACVSTVCDTSFNSAADTKMGDGSVTNTSVETVVQNSPCDVVIKPHVSTGMTTAGHDLGDMEIEDSTGMKVVAISSCTDNSAYLSTIVSLQQQLVEAVSSRHKLQEEITVLQNDCSQMHATMTALDSSVLKYNEEQSQLMEKNKSLVEQLTEAHREVQATKLSLQEICFVEKAYQDILKHKADLEAEVARLSEILDRSSQTAAETVNQLTESTSELNEKISVLTDANVKLLIECEELNREAMRLREEVASFKLHIRELEDEKKLVQESFQTSSVKHTEGLERLMSNETSLKAQLAQLEASKQSCEKENAVLQDKLKRALSAYDGVKVEFNALRTDFAQIQARAESATTLVNERSDRITELESRVEKYEKEITELQEMTNSYREQRDKVSGDLKEDLENMSSSVQRREKMWDNVRDSMEREILTLRFDLNAKITSQKTKIRELNEMLVTSTEEKRVAVERLQQIIDNLKKEHEHNLERAAEQLDDLKQCLGGAESDIYALRQQLQEKQSLFDAEREQWFKESVQMQSDISDLKERLIQLLKDKDSLWKKTDLLTDEKRRRALYHWMDSSEITNCLDCKAEFVVTLRKHHCRECGRVLCYNCCSNWLLTAHSGRKERVCNMCLQDMSNIELATSEGEDSDDEENNEGPNNLSELNNSVGAIQELYQDNNSQSSTTCLQTSATNCIQTITASSSSLVCAAPPDNSSETTNPANSIDISQTTGTSNFDSWRVTEGAKAAVSWLASTTTALAANVLPRSVSRSTTAVSISEDANVADAKNKDADAKESGNVPTDGTERGSDNLLRSRSSSSVDVFSEITSEELTESLLYPLPDPNTICGSLMKLEDFEGVESIDAPSDLWVKAGKCYAVPVLLNEINSTLYWQFSTQPKGISFSVTYKESDVIPYQSCEVLIPSCKVNSHLKMAEGELEARKPGVYTLIFDNSQSRFTGKKIEYKLQAKRASQILTRFKNISYEDSHDNVY